MAEAHRWHPLLAAHEGPTGPWSLFDGFERVYGIIELHRMNATEVRYRASFRGNDIGWSNTLRLACERVHAEFLRNHARMADRSRVGAVTTHVDRSRSRYAASTSSSSRKSSAGSSTTPSSVGSSEVSGFTRRRVRSSIPAGPRSTL